MSDTLLVRVPFRVRKHGGRKLMVAADGTASHARPSIDNTLMKALARAFRWKRLLEDGEYAAIGELAKHERIAKSYMTRVLRMTLLAPDVVEAILDGTQDAGVTLAQLLGPFPVDWDEQRVTLCSPGQVSCRRRNP